jgi:hypothetical protein
MIGKLIALPSLRALKQFRRKRVKASCEKIGKMMLCGRDDKSSKASLRAGRATTNARP